MRENLRPLRRAFCAALAALLLTAAVPCAEAAGAAGTDGQTAGAVETSAKAVVLMERETGTVLYSENPDEELPPASVTKVMTMLLVAEALDAGTIQTDTPVTASAYAASMGGSQVYLKEGEQMTVDDLLKAVAVASGNDAAVALAEHLAGSESAFVDRMNQKAAELGMTHTHFANCNGLPAEGHYTSACDIALMSRALLGHHLIRDYTTIWMDTLRDGTFGLTNTNKLIRFYPGATGLKTGFTVDAGFCISASAVQGGMELIAVVLGSENSTARFETAKNLLNYGFAGWTMADAAPAEGVPAVPVRLGTEETAAGEITDSLRVLVEKSQAGSVTTEYQMEEEVTAPVSRGDRLGTLRVLVDGEAVREVPITAAQDIPRKAFWELFRDLVRSAAMQEDAGQA